MLSTTRGMPVDSPAPGVIPGSITGPVSNGSPAPTDAGVDPGQASAAAQTGAETRGEHFRRKAHRSRLYGYAVIAVALVAFLIALAASNTAQVKVSWVFGTSRVSLVWLVLFAAILGWLLGLLASARLHWRTRAPRRQSAARS
jgi:uncharacterized integral membrane protein